MCIAHGHGDGRVTKHLLQGQDVPASDDEVISEGMSKHMLSLAMRKLDRGGVQDTAEMPDTVRERALVLAKVTAPFFTLSGASP